MLSTENPPPDLSEEIIKSVGSDERTSGNNQHQFEVDLCKSGLDDNNNNPLPKFSIRDYVFSARGKDIGNNWPFSQKNLQLCLKHGVKDVLPPFQSLGSVGNLAVDNLRDSDVQHSELIAQKINSSESEEDKEFPSTTTSQSCSDINSVPQILEPKAVQLPLSPAEKQEFPVRGLKKAESNGRSPVKKCRLIVKLNNIAEPKSNEDLVAVSETMTSIVCPVCKTFTSSSNTTLNAHIDQCLAGESSVKWTANSKVIKHRIKARKTKLMVDIYETALPCTLEDLDKRNGTNWASNLGPPSQDLEASGGEEEKKTYSSVNREDINQEGAVYIDSSGTKLRILSKLSNPPSNPNAEDDAGPGFVKRDKGRKLLSSKKKKYFVHKGKLHGHSFDGQGSCSPTSDHLLEHRPHRSNSCYHRLEVDNGQKKLFDSEVFKEDDPTQHVGTSGEMKLDDFGMIKKWVGSKRTGLKKKKINRELENQHPDKSTKNLRIKSVSSLGDTLSKGNTASTSPASSDEYHPFPTQSHKRKDNLLCNSQDSCLGPTGQRKRPAFSLLKPQHVSDKKNHLMFSKFNVKQSRKDNTSVQEHHMDPPDGAENHVSSRYNKKMGISGSTNEKDDRSFIGSNVSQHHRISSEGNKFASVRKTSLGHSMSSGSKKLSSLRTKLLSVRNSSVTESKKNKGRKLLNSKNTRLLSTSGSDEEEAVVSRSAIRTQDTMIETRGRNEVQLEKDNDDLLIKRTRVLKIRKKMRVENFGEGDIISKSLETSHGSDGHSVGKNVDSFAGGNVPIDSSDDMEEEAEMQDEFVSGPTYGGKTFVSFNKSLDSAFPGLTDSSTVECGSHFYVAPTGLVLNADQDHVVAEMDVDEGQGNYFVDVDPIPIPGPPGSFLPSPGRMGSEELQGHSSLTTCRIQSSEEGHDMDSSDSPISAISAASNSVAARSNSISITNLSEQSHLQHETRFNISEERSGPVIERCSPFEQVASGDRELNLLEARPNLMSHQATRESQNIQQCCCSRKDGSFQGGSLEYQDSQRRRTMTSPALPQEKHTSDDRKNEIYSLAFTKNGPTPEPENHAVNSPMGYTPLLVSRNSETMFPAGGDCESPSPSTPNPVLRLMGKNLMVVNNDENPSPQTRPTHSGMIIDHPAPRSCAENTQNEPSSYHHNRGPSTFNNLQPSVPSHHFDFNSSNGFKVPANCGPPGFPTYPSMFSGTNFGGSVSSKYHGYATGFNLIADQLGSKIRLDPHTIYNTGKDPVDSSGGKHKEIIIIDDSPEGESGLAVNPFCTYQTRVYPRFSGSPTGPTGNALTPSTKAMTEGSSAFHSNSSSAAPLPSTAHLRSSVYFSPGFS